MAHMHGPHARRAPHIPGAEPIPEAMSDAGLMARAQQLQQQPQEAFTREGLETGRAKWKQAQAICNAEETLYGFTIAHVEPPGTDAYEGPKYPAMRLQMATEVSEETLKDFRSAERMAVAAEELVAAARG